MGGGSGWGGGGRFIEFEWGREGGGVGWGRSSFEAGRLLTFSAFRLGAHSNKYGINRALLFLFFDAHCGFI